MVPAISVFTHHAADAHEFRQPLIGKPGSDGVLRHYHPVRQAGGDTGGVDGRTGIQADDVGGSGVRLLLPAE